MFPFLGALASVAVPAIASAVGQERANRTNMRLAREQMAFQERMSSTSWQRAVADMRLAGINPALSYMQGGASSPGGAMARVEDAVGPAVSSAMHAVRLRQEMKLMEAQRENVEMDSAKKEAEAKGQLIWNDINAAGGTDVMGKFAGMSPVPIPYRIRIMQQTLQNLMSEGRVKEATAVYRRMQTELAKADLPARKVLGSKAAGVSRLVFGGGGALPGIAKPVLGAFGLSKFGKFARAIPRRGRKW